MQYLITYIYFNVSLALAINLMNIFMYRLPHINYINRQINFKANYKWRFQDASN